MRFLCAALVCVVGFAGCFSGHQPMPEMSKTDESNPSDALPYDFPLSNIQAKVVDNTVTITWESSIPADSRVSYGHVSTDDGGVMLPDLTTSHQVVIAGLEEGNYRYQVESRAGELRSAVDDSLEFDIRIYPKVSSLWAVVNSAQGNTTTFTFDTDVPVVSAEVRVLDSTVNPIDFVSGPVLKVSKSYDIVSNPVTSHSLALSIPLAGLYRYIVTVVDDEGDVTVADNGGIGFPLTVSTTVPEGGIYRPIVIDTSPLDSGGTVSFMDNTRDTSASGSSAIDFYDPASQNESGPEYIYKFTVTSDVKITDLSISGDGGGVDNDIHLLSSLAIDGSKHATLYQNSATYRDNLALTTPLTLPAGTYYIAVDAFNGAGQAGPYTLTVNMQSADAGTTANPIAISVPDLNSQPSGYFSYADDRDTNYSNFAPNGEIDYYSGYSQNESGPEFIYTFTLAQEAVVTATLSNMPSGTDIDIHLLSDLSIASGTAQNVIGRNDKTITYTLAPGTYYLSADSYVTGSGTKKPGPYHLAVSFQSTSFTPPPASHVVQGYYTFFNGYRGDTYIQYDKLTHFIYFCMEFNSDGSVDTLHGWRTDSAVTNAIAQGKVVLLDACVFGGSKIATLLGSSSNRTRFIQNIFSEVQSRGAHGVDIDFEIPKSSSRADLVTFFQELRSYLNAQGNAPDGKPYRIHVALVPIDWGNAFDMTQITPLIDYAMIMSYGIHGRNSSRAGPGNQLYSPRPPWYYPYSWEYFINHWLGKMGSENSSKLLAGVGYYSYEHPVQSWDIPGVTTGSGITRTYSYTLPLVDAAGSTYDIGAGSCEGSGWSICTGYEDTSKNPYYFRKISGVKHQLWYDTQSSLEEKYAYIKGRNLGGVGIWALNYDKGRQETWLALGSQFFP